MAERLAYLEAVVGADITEFRKSMRDIRNDVGILSETISGIGGAARTMTFAFTTPMVALGTYAVQAASGFDATMRNINSIMGLTEDGFQSLSLEVMDFAKTTRAGVVPATEALYEIFSAGITDQDRAMAVWKTSTKVAEAGLADLTQTTNAMTATMSAFNLETSEATRVGNVWSRMVQLGVGSLGDFLSNSQKILPLSAAMNISLEDMGATLAFLSQGGGGAAKAETAYAMMLSNMMKPTEAMTTALHKLGVATGSELLTKFGSVSEAVMALKGASNEIDFNKMFSKTGLEAALRITGNIDAMRESIVEFNDGLDTATMDAWNEQAKSFAFQWDLMKTALEGVAIVIGQAIMPLITPLIVGFGQFLSTLSDVNPELVQLGVIFVGVVAAAAPIIWLLTSLLNPIGLVIAGVTALSAAIGTNFNGIRDKILSVVSDITGGLAPFVDIYDTFMAELFPETPDTATAVTSGAAIGNAYVLEIGRTISAWDAYEDREEALKGLSWDEFQKWLRDNGWEGGALTDGMSFTFIDPAQATKLGTDAATGISESFDTKMRDMFGAGTGQGEQNELTIFQRLEKAITAAWPKLQTALDGVWSNFKNWVVTTGIPAVDQAGKDIISSIANWFNTSSSNFEGDGAVYDVLTGMMTTDVAGAVSNGAGIFAGAFPGITAALQGLLDSVGDWLIAEGVPTMARSIGFMAGRIASMIRDAIGGIWGAVSGSDGGAGVAGATEVISTSITQPLMEGISEGVGENDGNIFDKFMDGISTALLLAAVGWVIAPSVVTAVATPIIGVISSAFTTALTASGTLTAIKGLVSGIGVGMATAFSALSVLGIGAIIIGALLSNEDIANGLKAWAGVWDNMKIIMASAADSTAVFLRKMFRHLETFLADIEFKINVAKLVLNPNDEAARAAGQQAGNTLLGNNLAIGLEEGIELYLAGATLPIDASNIVPFLTGNAGNPVATTELLNSITDPQRLSDAVKIALQTQDLAAMQVLIPAQIAYTLSLNPTAPLETTITQLMSATGLDAESIGTYLGVYYGQNPAKVAEIAVAVEKVKVSTSTTATTDTSALTGTSGSDWISRAVANSTDKATVELPVDAKPIISAVDEATKTWADTVVKTLPTAVTTAVTAANGDMTVASASMTAPFETAFTNAFGEGGSVSTVWGTFLADYVTDVGTMQTKTDEVFPKIESTVVASADKMTQSILGLNNQLKETANRLNALVQNSPYTMTVKVVTEGQVPTTPAGSVGADGSHANGLASVPFDGYIAELHKGERVLTAAENAAYSSRAALPSSSPTTEIDQSSPTFVVNGVQNFDQFLREAKRRGYNLDKYKR